MIFRLIASVFHLIAVVARREAAIDSLKEKTAKAAEELRDQKAELKKTNRRMMVLEVQRESDEKRIATLEKSLASHRKYADEIHQLQNQNSRTTGERLDTLNERVTLHLSKTSLPIPNDN